MLLFIKAGKMKNQTTIAQLILRLVKAAIFTTPLLLSLFAQGQTVPELSLSISHYNAGQYLMDDQIRSAVTAGSTKTLKFRATEWKVKTTIHPVRGNPAAKDVMVNFLCSTGNIDDVSLSVILSFNNWSAKNYVLIPAAAYNGNRSEVRILPYCPFVNDPRDTGVTRPQPQLLSDVPRLSLHKGKSGMQLRSGDMATPGIGFYAPATKKSFFFLTKQGTRIGDYGLSIKENDNRTAAEMCLTAPVFREKYRYYISNTHYLSSDKGASFRAGDSLSITFRMYDFDCTEVQDLFNQFAAIRSEIIPSGIAKRIGFTAAVPSATGSEPTVARPAVPEMPIPEPEVSEPAVISFSAAFKIQEEKFNRQNYVPQYGYYAVGMRENASQDWQIGWVGGMQSTYPLLFQGNETSVANVIRNFDWLFPAGISPSGYFWDTGEKGANWMGIFKDMPMARDLHLIRKSGDGLYYCIKQFLLMEKKGITVKDNWKNGCVQVADAMVKTWNTYQQFGQFLDNKTGRIVIGGSASGGIIPAALVLASRYYNNVMYMTVAREAAAYYYSTYVKKGMIYGGPGDAMQNCDSESTYGLLESYIILYEETREQQWLDAAEDVAKQFSTWVTSYNYSFPETSDLGKIKAHSLGTVWANTQNKHAAPGICTHSGVSLLKLYRATGDKFYLNLLRDIAHAIPQYLSTTSRPLGNLENAWMSERVSLTDWLEGIGQVFKGSTWAETSLMLTSIEVPGIYINTDEGEITVIDHVNARVVKQTNDRLDVELHNPTRDKVVVRLLAENKTQRKAPLGNLPLWNSANVQLDPGQSKVIQIKK